MTYDISVAIEARADVGEAPFWDDATDTLIWVDILGKAVHVSDPSSGETVRTYDIGQEVGAAVPREGGGSVLAVRDGILFLDGETGGLEEVAGIEAGDPGNRMNDAKCDPAGRFWAGTCAFDLTPQMGALYRFASKDGVVKVLSGVTLSNGLAWSPDARSMYYTDSMTQRVDVFDFDLATGDVENRRPFAEVPAEEGLPDGITVDAEGGVWLALWEGGQLRRYDPAGRIERIIELPVKKVTNCAFGGPDLTSLYITTGAVGLTDAELRSQPHAGSVLLCQPGVAGLPGQRFKG